MSYFIFINNFDNTEGTLYKIAENQSDLNNLNINRPDYKIIQESISNFNDVKLGNKFPNKYNNDIITFINQTTIFKNKDELQTYINEFKNSIKQFTDNNPNHPLFNRWNNYYIQLNNLNLENITYPLNKSLEQYFTDSEQTSLHILQIP
jgi:hypothetical protein